MSKTNKKFKIATLGCRTNQYESQAYFDQLIKKGYTEAKDGEVADVCIVNTCTVTEQAHTSSKAKVRQLAKSHPKSKILVTGCAAENTPDQFVQIAGAGNVIGNNEKDHLLSKAFPEEQFPEFEIKRFDAHTRAFVKVQDGCNSYCTYCIIPYVRGRSRSRDVGSIIKEVEALIENGYQEVVLTGINIGDFDGGVKKGEEPVRLSELIREVDAIDGLKRLRVSSIDPDEVDDDLADAILNGKNTCRSMHIVLQSGSNVILKRMNRKYTRQIFFDTVDRLKSACPEFTFTTDVIVGFPGETEIDHRETLDAIREVQFAKVHMFPYSDRQKTRAATMPNKVAPEIVNRRKKEVMRLSEHVAFELRDKYVGKTMPILTERGDKMRPNEISGHTDNFLMVWIPSTGILSNELVDVNLIENTPDGLIAVVADKHKQNIA